MTKKELCKKLNLKRPWLIDQWIASGRLPEPKKEFTSGRRIYTEEHVRRIENFTKGNNK